MAPINHPLHIQAKAQARKFKTAGNELIETLIKIQQTRLFAKFGYASLFVYAETELKFSKAEAYHFHSVAKKSAAIPELREALREGRLSVNAASKITSALTSANAKELVEFRINNTEAATMEKLSQVDPKRKLSKKVDINADNLKKLKRVQEITGKDLNTALGAALDKFIEANDPVAKAERARSREAKKPKVAKPSRRFKRVPIDAPTLHKLALKYGDQCAFHDHRGGRCPNRRYVHIHHRKPVSQGGTNDIENLVPLCAEHHDQVHQLHFDFEGAFNWITPSGISNVR